MQKINASNHENKSFRENGADSRSGQKGRRKGAPGGESSVSFLAVCLG
jgi:hypothetical protein